MKLNEEGQTMFQHDESTESLAEQIDNDGNEDKIGNG